MTNGTQRGEGFKRSRVPLRERGGRRRTDRQECWWGCDRKEEKEKEGRENGVATLLPFTARILPRVACILTPFLGLPPTPQPTPKSGFLAHQSTKQFTFSCHVPKS